jgi:hypothetical protein
MYYVKNLSSTTLITLGANEFTISPSGELEMTNEAYERLIGEITALLDTGIISVDVIPYFSVTSARALLSGIGAFITPEQVLGGLLTRSSTGPIVTDLLPTAAALLAIIPGCSVGTELEFSYVHLPGGSTYSLLAAGAGITFVDDWNSYSNSVEVREGCVVNIKMWCTATSPAAFSARVLSNTGSLSVDQGLAARFALKTAAPISTADDVQYTVAQLAGGLILRDPAAAPRNDSTPTAADIVAWLALPINGGVKVGSFLEFTIKNIGVPADNITFSPTAGVTLYDASPDTLVAPSTNNFLLIVDNIGSGTEAVTIYKK